MLAALLPLLAGAMAAQLPTPEIVSSRATIPGGDGHQTQVVLRAEPYASGGVAGQWELEWIVPGAQHAAAGGDSSAQTVVTFSGKQPVPLEVRVWPAGSPELAVKDEEQLGLEMPTADLYGTPRVWHTTEVWFEGPATHADAVSPNPFLDLRLDVQFRSPSGEVHLVPGFYDGDGRGGLSGNVWKARFTPDEAGAWRFLAQFRAGPNVAIAPDEDAGTPTGFDGATGDIRIKAADPDAPGFHAHGTLEHVGGHYLRHRDGTWFLKGGTNSPENLLGYRGFTDVVDQGGSGIVHEYTPHAGDVTIDDPVLPGATWKGSRQIFGALRYLSEAGVNSVYFLPMNLGGDGQETSPFLGYEKTHHVKTHYHVGRLLQWEKVFAQAQCLGIMLHFVLGETETANENWLDDGQFGVERALYLRELVARFSHHNAIKWNLAEENDYPVEFVRAVAARIRALDPYTHPIGVHVHTGDSELYEAIAGSPDFDATSIQYKIGEANTLTELWRDESAKTGRPWIIDMDENGTATIGASPTNASEMRKEILYDIYFSGGQIEWYLGNKGLPTGGDQTLEDFRTRDELWMYTRNARELLESLPFWLIEPADQLVAGESQAHGGAETFRIPNRMIGIYLPDASGGGLLDLRDESGPWEARWWNPRTGEYVGEPIPLPGGQVLGITQPPLEVNEDWVVLLRRPSLWSENEAFSATLGGVQPMHLDAGPALEGAFYLMLGSATGTAPGIPLAPGLVLPLNTDAYFWYLLTLPPVPLTGMVGVFDGTGAAEAAFMLPPDAGSTLAGVVLHHAWFTPFEGTRGMVSNPLQLTFFP
jgi:hypothetical protein